MGGGRLEDLGVFSAAELRACGINDRGIIQPVMPAGRGVDTSVEARHAAAGLASRGLIVGSGSRWQPVGRLRAVLESAAAGRAFVTCQRADQIGTGGGNGAGDRLVFGRLGNTDRALDLIPAPGGYRARLTTTGAAASEIAAFAGLGNVPAEGDQVPSVAAGSEGWDDAIVLLDGAGEPWCIEAASVAGADGPAIQQRLTVYVAPAGTWMVLGSRQGDETNLLVAPAGPRRVARVLAGAVSGDAVLL
ncbi:MAG: hypothetical protein ACRDYY_08420 [Acidimicrobiales bacterium]